MNASLNSGQGHSFAVCQTLAAWLAEDPSCTITFVHVPSKLEWVIHKESYDYTKSLISQATSLDSVQKAVTKHSQETWTCVFENSTYKHCNFLHLKCLNGDALKPT